MKLKHKKHWLLAACVLTIFLVWPRPPVFSKSSPPIDYAKQAITLSRVGDMLISPIVRLQKPFNVLGLKLGHVAKGMQVNFNPLGVGEWEPFEVHDDGFGPEALIISRPITAVQFKKTIAEPNEQSLAINADIFFSGGAHCHSERAKRSEESYQ